MFHSKQRRFQMIDHQTRVRSYPVGHYIYSPEQHDIVTLYNRSYEMVFENATGRVINILSHPVFYNTYHSVMRLLKFMINFKAHVDSSLADDELLIFLGIYDIYLIPVIKVIDSETLLPAFKTDEKLWISEAQMTGSPTYFIEMFHLTLWLTFAIFFIAIGCIAPFALNRLKKFSTTPTDTFTWVSIVTQQGVDARPKFISQQLVLLSLSILTIMFYGSFGAFMSSYLAMRKPDLPFNDLAGLLNAKEYTICIPRLSKDVYKFVESELIVREKQSGRLNNEQCPGDFKKRDLTYITDGVVDDWFRNCPTRKTAIISGHIWGLFIDGSSVCRIMLLPGSYFPSYMGVLLSQSFKYHDHFNCGVIRVMSAGHTKYIYKQFEHRSDTNEMHQYIHDEEDVLSITLHQTKIVFGILICGIVLSMLVLVVEMIIVNLLHH